MRVIREAEDNQTCSQHRAQGGRGRGGGVALPVSSSSQLIVSVVCQ